MRNKLIRLAVQKGTTVDAMMTDLIARDRSVSQMAKELDVSTGSVRFWLYSHGYRAVEVVHVKWEKV